MTRLNRLRTEAERWDEGDDRQFLLDIALTADTYCKLKARQRESKNSFEADRFAVLAHNAFEAMAEMTEMLDGEEVEPC